MKNGKAVAFMEAKKPGKDLFAALDQAKNYARRHRENGGNEIALVFASDGKIFLRQNLRANTLPEKINKFPTPAGFKEFFNPQTASFRLFNKYIAGYVLIGYTHRRIL